MFTKHLTLIIMLCILIFALWNHQVQSEEHDLSFPYQTYRDGDFFFPPYESESERIGVGKSSNHDMTPLQAGWYLDWMSQNDHTDPNGMAYIQTIYFYSPDSWDDVLDKCRTTTQVSQISFTPDGQELIKRIKNNPGALWQVGNEPDSYYNGTPMTPELYAEMYHHFYTIIKETDPLAKVTVGGIVQPSPIRLDYLDAVLNHYQATYGEPFPIDLWNIHFYIFLEGECFNSEHTSWGATVPPPNTSNSNGWVIEFSAEDMLRLIPSDDKPSMEGNLRAFRQWMFDRGYKDKPLIITEYGILPRSDYDGFENEVASQFMIDTMNMFLTLTDSTTGLQSDGGRLLQMWAWFSTNHDSYGGNLFNADGSLTPVGETFIQQTTNRITPYVDLQIVPSQRSHASLNNRMSVDAFITNQGNTISGDGVVRITLTDVMTPSIQFTEDISIGSLNARYQDNYTTYISKTWMFEPPYAYTITITANPDQTITETNHANNMLSYVFRGYVYAVYLPLIVR